MEAASTKTQRKKHAARVDDFEDAFDRAFRTGKADRAQITREAQESGAEALRLVGEAMQRDEMAEEATRLAVITEASNDRSKIRAARKRAKVARKEAKKTHRQATARAKESYEDIKFSEPGKLGFMRVMQVIYALHIVVVLAALLLSSRDTIRYDSVTIVDWITIILEAVAFWFFVNYYKVARPFMMAISVFEFVSSVIIHLAQGDLTLTYTLSVALGDILMIVYFWKSKRVKAVLVNDFSSLDFKPSHRVKVQQRGWPLIRNLIMYFVIFSILGHWMEAAMCQLIRLGLVQGEYDPSNTMLWRDWLYPFPMEGAAVVIIALVLYPLWQRMLERYKSTPVIAYIISFLANALTCSLIEFSMGLIVNADLQLWDYTDNFCNIMGQVCLQNAVAFGVAASLITWFVYPMLARWLARVPNDILNIAFVVIAVFGGILWSLYLFDPPQNHLPEEESINTEAEEEAAELYGQILDLNLTIVKLQGTIENSESLTDEQRKEAQERLDKLLEDAESFNELDVGNAA